jgi:hypothetical protein
LEINALDHQNAYPQRAPLANRLRSFAFVLISLCCLAVFFGNLRFGRNVLAIGLEDDFFYYAEAARHLAVDGLSSFDGIHKTNGYHPLWMLVVTCLTKLFDVGGLFHASTIFPFAVALETIQFALVLAIAFWTYRLCRLFCGVAASVCVQLLMASWGIVMARTGMETGLAVLAALCALWFRLRKGFTWNAKSCAWYGLLASIMILARLDLMLLVGLLLVFDVVPNGARRGKPVSQACSFALGLFPVPVYFAVNMLHFHTVMPISGTAKQLRAHHIPALKTLVSFAGFIPAKVSPLLGPAIVLTLLALVLLFTQSLRLRKNGAVLFSVLTFPFLHLLAVSTLSDWPIWQWYLYPWIISAIVAAAIILERDSRRQRIVSWAESKACVACCAAYLLLYSFAVTSSSRPQNNLPYMAAIDIKAFVAQHEGLYAMGDRAGAVGYLASQPVLQTEGLMMDAQYLDNIRKKRDLLEVLRGYGVRYYISTRAVMSSDGCWVVKEPFQAGPDSPAMIGRLCQRPLAEIKHGAFVNQIFDLLPHEMVQSNPVSKEGHHS